MYKYFAIIFYFFPIILVLSALNKNGSNLNNIFGTVLLIGVFFYVLFPVLILIKNFVQIKKDNSIKLFLEKHSKKIPHLNLSNGLAAPIIKITLATTFILLSIYTSILLFTYLLHSVFGQQINLISDIYKNRSALITEVGSISNKLKRIEGKLDEDDKNDFFINNSKEYNFNDKLAKFSLWYQGYKPNEFDIYTNKYEYAPVITFSDNFISDYNNKTQSTGFSGFPHIMDDEIYSTGEAIWLFQDEKIEDFYADSYSIGEFYLPVFVGVVETNRRDVSFILYPEYENGVSDNYVLIVTTANNNSYSNSLLCDYYSSESNLVSFKCANKSLSDKEKVDYDTWDKIYTVSVNADGKTEVNFERVEQ